MAYQSNKHEILVNSGDVNKAFREIVLWGEATWWPSNCKVVFIPLDRSPIQVGTQYRQKVLIPFAPSWFSLVKDIKDNQSITRKLHKGFLDAEEVISIIPKENSLKIKYHMEYRVKGRLYRILWKLFLHKMHNKNISLILGNLKIHLENGSIR